jgi:hypothetical protein
MNQVKWSLMVGKVCPKAGVSPDLATNVCADGASAKKLPWTRVVVTCSISSGTAPIDWLTCVVKALESGPSALPLASVQVRDAVSAKLPAGCLDGTA